MNGGDVMLNDELGEVFRSFAAARGLRHEGPVRVVQVNASRLAHVLQ